MRYNLKQEKLNLKNEGVTTQQGCCSPFHILKIGLQDLSSREGQDYSKPGSKTRSEEKFENPTFLTIPTFQFLKMWSPLQNKAIFCTDTLEKIKNNFQKLKFKLKFCEIKKYLLKKVSFFSRSYSLSKSEDGGEQKYCPLWIK